MKTVEEPKTLQEAIITFADPDNALWYMAAKRWPTGVSCPTCGRVDVNFLAAQRRWQCKSKHALRQFTAKVGTVFEDSPLPLEKWLPAVWMITNAKNGISSWEIHRALDVTQKTAWFMLHRIRLAMQSGSLMKLGGGGGEVEADETFIGGKARNMHKSVHDRRISGMGQSAKDKTIVMGILERGGDVRTALIPDRQKHTLQPIVRQHVEPRAALYTDEMGGYKGLNGEYVHQIIDHAVRYVNGRIHTNGMENFWSLLKRSLGGTYISVEPFHLFRYLDEQAFRFNNRAKRDEPVDDSMRFQRVMSMLSGKRLTFDELTGKARQPAF
jgi:transposase-like protein